jgi:hypothetical protein
MHAAHGSAHHEPQMIYSEALSKQAMLGFHHVGVTVLRKLCAQPVARLRGLSVADAIRQHDEITTRVEQLARTKQLARELRTDELRAAAASAVADQYGIPDDAVRILLRFAQGAIVDAQLWQRRAAGKLKVAKDDVAFDRCRVFGGVRSGACYVCDKQCRAEEGPASESQWRNPWSVQRREK